AVLWATAPALCGFLLLAKIKPLADWLTQSPTYGLAGYIAVFMVSAGLGFLPTYAQSILGGWVFGFTLGFPAALLGFAGGSLIGYFVARGVSQQRVQDVINSRPKWKAVREALIGQGFWKTFGIIALVRLPPNSPFAVTNLLLSTAGVRLLPYTLGTIVGMAPRTGLAVFLAHAAASSAATTAGAPTDILTFVKHGNTWVIIGGLAVFVIVLAIIGALANKAIDRVTAARPASAQTTQP
ncbi:MAG: TVP38/TMEM64 family protein, partial [Phycisphaerales bacterium]